MPKNHIQVQNEKENFVVEVIYVLINHETTHFHVLVVQLW